MIKPSKIKKFHKSTEQCQLNHKQPFLTKNLVLQIPNINQIKLSKERIHWSATKKVSFSRQFRYKKPKEIVINHKLSQKMHQRMSFTQISINNVQTGVRSISVNDNTFNQQVYEWKSPQTFNQSTKRFKTLTTQYTQRKQHRQHSWRRQNNEKNEKNINFMSFRTFNFNKDIQAQRIKIRRVLKRKDNCKNGQFLNLKGVGYKLQRCKLKQYQPIQGYTTIS